MSDNELEDRVIWALRDGRPQYLAELCRQVEERREAAVEAAVRAVGGHVYREGPRTRRLATVGMAGRVRHRNIIERMERAADLASWAAMEAIGEGPGLYDDEVRRAVLAAVGESSLSGDIRTVIADWVKKEMAAYRDIGVDEDGGLVAIYL